MTGQPPEKGLTMSQPESTETVVQPMRRGKTDAETCRLNGWGVGTRLEGDEGHGPSVIEITAVGERVILARLVSHRGDSRQGGESCWTLECREWRRVGAAPAANVPVVDPARVARYAEAIVPHTSDGYDVDDDPTGCWCKERLDGHRWSDHLAEVVVAVADSELAELRAEVEQEVEHCEALCRRVEREVDRAEAAESKVAVVEALAAEWERDETLHEFHEDFEAGIGWPPGTFFAHRLRAALAAASPDGPAAAVEGGE